MLEMGVASRENDRIIGSILAEQKYLLWQKGTQPDIKQTRHTFFMLSGQNLASHSYVIGQLKVVEFTSQEQLLRMACNLEHVF